MTEKLKMEQSPLSVMTEKIREICPSAVTRDGKIDFEVLKSNLATLKSTNLHGLVKMRPRLRQIVQFVKHFAQLLKILETGTRPRIYTLKGTTLMP